MYQVLKDFKGSPDGYTVVEYRSGQQVPLPPALALEALAEGWVAQVAAAAPDQSAKPVRRRKATVPPPPTFPAAE